MMSEVKIISPVSLSHPNVKSVIEVAEDIIAERKRLNIDNLYHRAKRKLKIPRKGLLSIIQFLVNKRVLVDRSKFTKHTILANPIRMKIYKFIMNNLGAHLSLIRDNIILSAQVTSLGTGQLLWHLDMLLKFRIIKKLSIKNHVIFLPTEIDNDLGKIFFFLRDDLNFKIVSLLIEETVLKRSEIYKRLGESRELVYYHINNLIDHNLIEINEKKELKIHVNYQELILDTLDALNKSFHKGLITYEEEIL